MTNHILLAVDIGREGPCDHWHFVAKATKMATINQNQFHCNIFLHKDNKHIKYHETYTGFIHQLKAQLGHR